MNKKLFIAALTVIACLAFTATAFAYTNTQIENDICHVEGCNGHVNLTYRSGSASSGTVKGTMCSSQYVYNNTEVYLAYKMVFYFNATYSTRNGALWVTMGTMTSNGIACT